MDAPAVYRYDTPEALPDHRRRLIRSIVLSSLAVLGVNWLHLLPHLYLYLATWIGISLLLSKIRLDYDCVLLFEDRIELRRALRRSIVIRNLDVRAVHARSLTVETNGRTTRMGKNIAREDELRADLVRREQLAMEARVPKTLHVHPKRRAGTP